LQTAGGVKFDVNGTTTTSGSEDKFKVEVANTIENAFHVDSTGGAWFDVNNGFHVHENTANAYFRMTDLGRFEIYTEDTDASSVDTYTDGGYTIHTGGQFYSMSLTGFRFEENSGTFLEVSSAGIATLYAVNSLNLIEDSGSQLVIDNNGDIDIDGQHSSNLSIRDDGKIDIVSGDNSSAHINIEANNSSNVNITASGDDITNTSSIFRVNTDNFYVNDQAGSIEIISGTTTGITFKYNNNEKLAVDGEGINVSNRIDVGNWTGAQSYFQSSSTQNNAGHINTPWMYTSAIESSEKDTASTGIFMNDGHISSATDEIKFITNGNTAINIDSDQKVTHSSDTTMMGDLTVHGSFKFDTGSSVFEIVNIVDALTGPNDDQLVTEKAVLDYVASHYGQTLNSNGNYTQLKNTNGDLLDEIIVPYSLDTDKVDGVNFHQDTTDPSGTTRLNMDGHFYATKVYNAVWNDIADYITVEDECEIEYGKAYIYNGKEHKKTQKYAQKGVLGIASDTVGMGVGRKDNSMNQLPIAIGGFVLAYCDKEYDSGTPLVGGKHGILKKANILVKIFRPEAIIATFYRKEPQDNWYGVNVNNRSWVEVK
jgi:hypothetical protein